MTSPTDRNQRVVTQLWQALEEQRFAQVERLYDPDVMYHGSLGAELKGIFQVAALYRKFDAAFPGMQTTLESSIVQGDLVVSRLRASWDLADASKTTDEPRRCVRTHSFINTVRILDGRIVEEWAAFGPLDILRQLRVAA